MSEPQTEQGWAARNASRIGFIGVAIVLISAAAAALSGPLYKGGTLDLQGAFGVLRIALTWGFGIGVALCLLGTVLSIVAFKAGFLSRSWASILAIVIAAAVFSVPYGLMQRKAPPIHDITTDIENPPAFIAVVPLREASGSRNVPQYLSVMKMGEREFKVTELQLANYPDLAPVRFEGVHYEAVFDKALKAAEAMGWTMVASSPVLGRIEAYDTTEWFGFVDDVVIRVEAVPGAYEVDVRSKSRVGLGDIGTNAERIRNYISTLNGMR